MSASDGVLGITLRVSGCLLAPEHGVEKAERWRWVSHGVLSVERGVADVLDCEDELLDGVLATVRVVDGEGANCRRSLRSHASQTRLLDSGE